jgi:putative nucleotidyltransferase-like protein
MKVSARASVRDALRLRATALDLLGGRPPNSTLPLTGCSDRTWDVFLRTERCALALKARIAAAEREVPDPVEAAATRELQRILSARGQLQDIGQLAATHGIPAIVLKGGVAALSSPAPVDVQDVDVLVRPLQAERLAGLLDEEGFRGTGPAGTAHLAQRISPNAVQIEVHFALNDIELSDEMWSCARPLDGVAGLSRLGAADHLWHLLVHSVVTHPHRRGSLRDVLLAGEALRDCSPAELEDVERRAATHPLASPLGELLTMARELGDGRPVADRFRREAAANYVLRGPLGWLGFSRFWTPAFVSALFAQLGGMVERRREWVVAWQRPPFSSPWGFAARLERRSPRIGRWSRTAVKIPRLIVVRMAAWPVALAARLLAS